MSLPTSTLQRLPTIKRDLLLNKTIEQIAEDCHVRSITIDRDLAKFRASGEFETWLREEWTRLHYIIIHENPELAYMQLTRLLGQTLTKRVEATGTFIERRIILQMWKPITNEPNPNSTP